MLFLFYNSYTIYILINLSYFSRIFGVGSDQTARSEPSSSKMPNKKLAATETFQA